MARTNYQYKAENSRIIGHLFQGFGTKIIGVGFALWVGITVAMELKDLFAPITAALGGQ